MNDRYSISQPSIPIGYFPYVIDNSALYNDILIPLKHIKELSCFVKAEVGGLYGARNIERGQSRVRRV
jgi:hypothetical protein